MIDLLIRNGQVVTPDGIFQTDVAVEGEHIVAIGKCKGPIQRTIDAQGCYVMPGLVDAHVHMQCASWDAVSPNDFHRGTVAAALGGVTTIIDFATQERGRPMMEAVEKLQNQAEGNVVIDYSMHLSITDTNPTSLHEIKQVIEYGIPSFKMFTTYRSHNIMLEDDQILEVCRQVHQLGGLPGAHCENTYIAERNYARFEAQGKRSPWHHALAKPDYVEAEAVNRMLFLARVAESRFYIYHLTTAMGVEIVQQAQRAGQPVLAETCTHYLALTRDCLKQPNGENYICSPPLRDEIDQQALWAALRDGTISVISTDEAGFNASDKARVKDGPLDLIPNGIPGVELRLPVIYTLGVENGRLSLERFVKINSSNPARIFGLYPRKGVIAPGADADLIVVDPRRHIVLNVETQHMPTDWCAYEGLDVVGYPAFTIARGQVIVDNYRFCGQRGLGTFVPGKIKDQHLETLW